MSLPIWIKALIAAAIVAALIFAVNWYNGYQQDIGYQRAVGEYAQKENAKLKEALAETARLNKQLEDAQNAGIEREKTIRSLAAAVGTASSGLRDTTANIRVGLSGASIEAARKAADAFAAVFTECTGRYAAVAEAADLHASDVKTMSDSWPK